MTDLTGCRPPLTTEAGSGAACAPTDRGTDSGGLTLRRQSGAGTKTDLALIGNMRGNRRQTRASPQNDLAGISNMGRLSGQFAVQR
jgi:hypothetical protein